MRKGILIFIIIDFFFSIFAVNFFVNDFIYSTLISIAIFPLAFLYFFLIKKYEDYFSIIGLMKNPNGDIVNLIETNKIKNRKKFEKKYYNEFSFGNLYKLGADLILILLLAIFTMGVYQLGSLIYSTL